MPHQLVIGRHTLAAALAIDEAIDRYLDGESSFLDITIPFRHGKSDLVSRALPGYFLGRCASKDPDIVMSGYGSSLVEGFSRDAKNIIRSAAYQRLFPNTLPGVGSDSVSEWKIEGRYGKVVAAGLGGALTGKGYHLGIIDDFCKSRAEAESVVYRDNTWAAFQNDFMTRRAPVSITIVCATSWHVDDIRGRIKKAEIDPEFPRFTRIHFSARSQDATGKIVYLFPERYPAKWYTEQYATLGRYASSGLLDGNPIPAEGNVAKRAWFPIVDAAPTGISMRGWDCAASSKRTADFTSAPKIVKAGTKYFIVDLFHEQVPAGAVLRTISAVASQDGKGVGVVVEEEGGSAGMIVASAVIANLSGWDVHKIRPTGDKLSRALPFLAQAEAGNVFLLRGRWNDTFITEMVSFPGGEHDDIVDSTAHTFNQLCSGASAGTW